MVSMTAACVRWCVFVCVFTSMSDRTRPCPSLAFRQPAASRAQTHTQTPAVDPPPPPTRAWSLSWAATMSCCGIRTGTTPRWSSCSCRCGRQAVGRLSSLLGIYCFCDLDTSGQNPSQAGQCDIHSLSFQKPTRKSQLNSMYLATPSARQPNPPLSHPPQSGDGAGGGGGG